MPLTTKNATPDTQTGNAITHALTRMRGLDAIRYICALFVVFNHVGPAYPPNIPYSSHLLRLATSLYQGGISGPAAVIVFFVISGLCIHFPYRDGKKIDYLTYFIRRYVRIGIPLLAAVALTQTVTQDKFHSFSIASLNNSVLWSLVAELIYYTLYPALMFLKKVVGWHMLLAIAFAAAYAVLFTHPRLTAEGFYPVFGWKLNWVLGLPCWLLGCLLAERLAPAPVQANTALHLKRSLWMWRGGVWAASCVTIFFQFHYHNKHIPLGYSVTLDLFAIPVYFWLRQEIAHFEVHAPLRWLEVAGRSSYSLYLTHPIVIGVLGIYSFYFGTGLTEWCSIVAEIIAASVIFYFAVERPSHLLARSFRYSRKHTLDFVPATSDRPN